MDSADEAPGEDLGIEARRGFGILLVPQADSIFGDDHRLSFRLYGNAPRRGLRAGNALAPNVVPLHARSGAFSIETAGTPMPAELGTFLRYETVGRDA
jgi:hypothetical protein